MLQPSPSTAVCAPASIRPSKLGGTSAGRLAPALALGAGALMMVACTVNAQLGPHAVAFKLHYAQLFILFAVALAGRRLLGLPASAWRAAAASALRATPWLLALCLLVGPHGLVSNGIDYQAMATDYWDADPFVSTSRRIGLPALAHLLTVDSRLYTVFWYAVFAAAFWAAFDMLVRRGLTGLEALSVATSSILAYALEGPGYGEVAVLLLGILLLRARTTAVEKAVAAAFMVATHETATPFVALTLALAGDARERRGWLAVFGVLYLAYAASFVATWHADVGAALLRAGKARVSDELTSPELLGAHPWLAGLGAFAAYKLCWLPLLAALRHPEARPFAALAAAALALAAAGSDTSRLVQFGSLPLFVAVSAELCRWSGGARRALAISNLALPSVYVATNAGPLWGPGLYSLYLRAAEASGIAAGRIFWH